MKAEKPREISSGGTPPEETVAWSAWRRVIGWFSPEIKRRWTQLDELAEINLQERRAKVGMLKASANDLNSGALKKVAEAVSIWDTRKVPTSTIDVAPPGGDSAKIRALSEILDRLQETPGFELKPEPDSGRKELPEPDEGG